MTDPKKSNAQLFDEPLDQKILLSLTKTQKKQLALAAKKRKVKMAVLIRGLILDFLKESELICTGKKELRGVLVSDNEEKLLKPKIQAFLDNIREDSL